MKDILIIGAGITGSFLAYDLSQYDLEIVVLDKSSDVGTGATKANSAIVHSGHDPKEGTLKAELNVLGSRMYEEICKTLNCYYKQIGAYVLACGKEEEKKLQILTHQAKSRNIPYEIHNRDVILKNEPNLSDEVTLGLYLPTTAIITPWEVVVSLVDNAIERGTVLHLNTEILDIKKIENGYQVFTNRGIFESKMILNCAGVHADNIGKMINSELDFTITARRGEYFVLDHSHKPIVNHVLYPVPSSKGKGVLLVPTIHNNVLLGPTSYQIDEKDNVDTTKDGLDSVRNQVSKLVNNVPFHQIIRTFSGNRPKGNTHDFIIQEDKKNKYFIHVAAIESPGIASAPAISQYVIEQIIRKEIELVKKENLPPIIQRENALNELSLEDRMNKIKEDNQYGRIICRCEQITEGEIVEAIHRNTPCTTVGAIKRRLRPGMGRCQGGFCEPLIVKILARELNLSEDKILLEDEGSNILHSKR